MKRAKKRTLKYMPPAVTEAEIKREVKKEINRENAHDAIRRAFSSMYPHQMHEVKYMIDQSLERGIDIGYLKTVLFPEQYSYDIPFPLSSVSYCKFTNKQEVTISTGTGNGMAVWFPRSNGGYQLWICNTLQTLPGPGQNGIGMKDINQIQSGSGTAVYLYNWQLALPQYSYQNFTQTAITAASLSVQYCGSVENEQGYLVGGHIYGVSPDALTTDDIENAQWVTRARPGEGLRFLHLPKDESDFQFYTCQKTLAMNQGANPVSIVQSIAGSLDSDNNLQLTLNGDGTAANKAAYVIASSLDLSVKQSNVTIPIANSQTANSGTTLSYVKNSNYVAFYWQGLQPNVPALRIDVTRKYCAMPTAQTRDIVELVRPAKSFDSRKTFDVLNGLCNTAPIGGHTLKEVTQVIDPLVKYLPNASYIMQNGGLEQVNTLSELVTMLQDITGEDRGLNGPLKMNTNRLYKFTL